MFCFRFIEDDSWSTKLKFDELWEVIEFCSVDVELPISNIFISYLCYDHILESDCYFVSYNSNGEFSPIGVLWEERSKNV